MISIICISKGSTSESECELLTVAETIRMEATALKSKVNYLVRVLSRFFNRRLKYLYRRLIIRPKGGVRGPKGRVLRGN